MLDSPYDEPFAPTPRSYRAQFDSVSSNQKHNKHKGFSE